jgi:hypothetical protein
MLITPPPERVWLPPGAARTSSPSPGTAFTQGEHLVPVVRDILYPSGIIFSPGRVWSEPGDGGMSRASFPFVFTKDMCP